MSVQVVWFKRDLRIVDHAALSAASAQGPVVALYIIEPLLWQQPDASGRQFAFLTECLRDLARALLTHGLSLTIRVGDAVAELDKLHAETGIAGLWSHEETGLNWSYDRDRAVKRWARREGIGWHEFRPAGVIRALKRRDGWARKWEATMARDALPVPEKLVGPKLRSDPFPSAEALGLPPDPCPGRQTGGRVVALDLLDSFTQERGRRYRAEMSSPVTAFDTCSRLSAHLALGTISTREALHAAEKARNYWAEAGDMVFGRSLTSFVSRLHWRCHFMQKLEDETSLETTDLHPTYRGMRAEPEPDDPKFVAWKTGQTGFPFVDACMRALIATGWLNFRMRAMLVSFSSYQLWQGWRAPAQHLAKLFTDYEPGIHYPQVQMQSGVTGINTIRIYNPVKQSLDQDLDGAFIRTWVPEIAALPDAFLHEPWSAPDAVLGHYGVMLGETYPHRIVDHVEAARFARDAIHAVRKGKSFAEGADAIQRKHGSRRSGMRHTGQRPKAQPKPPSPQLTLF